MAVNVLFWKPLACFDTFFNKFVATMTFGEYCHTEVDFVMTKAEWKGVLSSFQTGGKAQRGSGRRLNT